MLPDFLKCNYNARPNAKNTVINGNIRFSVITTRLIRIESGNFIDDASQSVLNRNFSAPQFDVEESDDMLTINTKYLSVRYKKGQPLSGDSLKITLLTKPYTCWHYGDKESFNLGGTVSTLDGVAGDCKIGDGVCSIDGYSIIDDSNTLLFDNEGWFKARQENTTDIYFFGYGHDYLACVQDYCKLTGEVKMLPAFALGNWWSRYYNYTQQDYLALMKKFRSNDIPLSVAIIDMDWHITDTPDKDEWPELSTDENRALGPHSGWTGYTWNNQLFPDYKFFLNELHGLGLKTSLNLHPSSGIRNFEAQYEKMANALGCDPNKKETIPFNCLSPEFMKAYFEILLFPYEKDGIDFWWMDWQQGTDYKWTHLFGIENRELEKIHPLWMLNHTHYLAAQRNNNRGLIFSRFAGIGSQRFPIGFSGDTFTAWETLEFQPYFTVTASNVGYGWWSHDICGHMGEDGDDELYTRWIQFAVFSPIMRLHSSCGHFYNREPWKHNLVAQTVVSKYMRLRHQLFPYLYTMNYRNYQEQTPLMLPMYYTHPEEKYAYTVKNQYWFGSELIVAPITKPMDQNSQLGYTDVWLPKGKWIDWFNGYVYSGNQKFECYRTIDEYPIFCKAGGIIPLQKHIIGDNTIGNSKDLEIVIAAGANGDFSLYEDDGTTLSYQDGNSVTRRFTLNWQDNSADFIIHKSVGNSDLIPNKRNFKLIFKGFKKDCKFNANFEYDSETNTYFIELNAVKSEDYIQIHVENIDGLLHDNSDYMSRCDKILNFAQISGVMKYHLLGTAQSLEKKTYRKAELRRNDRSSRAFYELSSQNFDFEGR